MGGGGLGGNLKSATYRNNSSNKIHNFNAFFISVYGLIKNQLNKVIRIIKGSLFLTDIYETSLGILKNTFVNKHILSHNHTNNIFVFKFVRNSPFKNFIMKCENIKIISVQIEKAYYIIYNNSMHFNVHK